MTRLCIALLAVTPLLADDHGSVQYFPADELSALPASLADALAKAPKDRVPYSQGTSPRHLIDPDDDANHYMDAIYRTKSGLAESHDVKADLYVVLGGEGEVVVGGTMPDRREMETRPGEWRGPKIVDGKTYSLKKGDMINIPSKTPHQIILKPGNTITYLIIKIIDK